MQEITVTSTLKEQLLQHPLYEMMQSKEDIHTFMESHIFAVWDFMSLLKSLQRDLTCTTTPWVPQSNPTTRFFINEIVLGEESDVDPDGGYISHFELYLKAMKESGANTQAMDVFMDSLISGSTVAESLEYANAPQEAKDFVLATFDKIEHKSLHERAALFTYGREDLIPGMFITMVEALRNDGVQLDTFIYYLKRHIELDGDHHGTLANQMTSALVNGNVEKQLEVDNIIAWGYQQRIELWNGIAKRIQQKRAELN